MEQKNNCRIASRFKLPVYLKSYSSRRFKRVLQFSPGIVARDGRAGGVTVAVILAW